MKITSLNINQDKKKPNTLVVGAASGLFVAGTERLSNARQIKNIIGKEMLQKDEFLKQAQETVKKGNEILQQMNLKAPKTDFISVNCNASKTFDAAISDKKACLNKIANLKFAKTAISISAAVVLGKIIGDAIVNNKAKNEKTN